MLALSKRLLSWPRLRKAQLALAVRVTVSAVVAFSIATALHLLLPLWAVLTSLIVTQMSVGRSLKVTRDYMFGTIGGAIYGGAIALLIPYSGEAQLLALLVLTVAPLAFIASINPSLNTATVTAVIVLLVPTMHHTSPLGSAIDRVMEVAVGAFTGLLVSFLVLPSRAHSQLRLNAARARRRRPAPDPGWHRRRAGRFERDRRGSRARARGPSVLVSGHRAVAANHLAAAPRRRDDRAGERGPASA